MRSEDYEAFKTVVEDLCAAFNRPCTDRLVRVFYESCKSAYIEEIQQGAAGWRRVGKKFPAPRDLMPEPKAKPMPSTFQPDYVRLSTWAVCANRVMLQLAYQDSRRGFVALGEDLLKRMLEVKSDYVRMAEDAERSGEPFDPKDYTGMLYEGFEKTLGVRAA